MVRRNGSFRALQKAAAPNNTIANPNAMNRVMSLIKGKKGLEARFKEI